MRTVVLFLVCFAMATIGRAEPVKSGYAPVNGLRLYYEIHGTLDANRTPLVLLHGGGDTIETSFAHLLPELARTRSIIALEQQGYGRTADVDRPFSFEQSADDTVAALRHLGIDRADVLGFSNGGTIALQVAIRHAAMVRKLVLISALYSRSGAPPEFWDWMNQAQLESMPPELQEAYRKHSPHPEKLRSFHDKAAQRMREFKDIPDERIRAITGPALVVIGDRDIVRPEHAVALMRLLPAGQLAVLPATDHMRMMQRSESLPPLIDDFLDAAVVE
jgi:pimeloyl-ACP methyl ester carboxylesterase